MPLISPSFPADGDDITAESVNEPLGDLTELVNGNLDGDNMADGGIPGSKITPGGIGSDQLDDDLKSSFVDGWQAISGSFSYTSTDGPITMVTVPAGAKALYTEGYRLKATQGIPLTSSWNLDSNSNDQKSGFNGTDTAITYTAGKFSNAATFNGTSSKIVISDNSSLKPTGPFTIGLWFKTSNTGSYKSLYQSYSANTSIAGVNLVVNTGNKIEAIIGKNTGTTLGSDYTVVTGTTTVTDGSWHYAVLSFQNGFAQLYLDGILEVGKFSVSPAYAATNYVRIGCQSNTGTDTTFMNGQIDDVFFINGWSASESWIKDKYAAQSAQGISNTVATSFFLMNQVNDTSIALYGGTDYMLINAAITELFYSNQKVPHGFTTNPDKWTIKAVFSGDVSQVSPTFGTWYNVGSASISIPIGVWDVSYKATLQAKANSSTVVDIRSTLSTVNNTESDREMTSYVENDGASATMYVFPTFNASKVVSTKTKTTHYLNLMTGSSGGYIGLYASSGPPTTIKAVSSLL